MRGRWYPHYRPDAGRQCLSRRIYPAYMDCPRPGRPRRYCRPDAGISSWTRYIDRAYRDCRHPCTACRSRTLCYTPRPSMCRSPSAIRGRSIAAGTVRLEGQAACLTARLTRPGKGAGVAQLSGRQEAIATDVRIIEGQVDVADIPVGDVGGVRRVEHGGTRAGGRGAGREGGLHLDVKGHGIAQDLKHQADIAIGIVGRASLRWKPLMPFRR